MKLCKICKQLKPYDPNAKRQSKAQGFAGNVCWACYTQAQRLRAQGSDPKCIELDAERQAAKAHFQELKLKQALELQVARRAWRNALIDAREQKQEQLYQDYQARERTKSARRIAEQDSLNKRFQAACKDALEEVQKHMSSPK